MSKFQQRHYEAIADLLRKDAELVDPDLAEHFIEMFKQDNERFKEDRFRKAAGL